MEIIEIKKDTFNINKRLKKIDKNYTLKFNRKLKRYEIYYKENNTDILQLVIGFDELDIRTLQKVLKTRTQNYETLIKELEETNKKIEEEKQNKILREAKDQIKEMSSYIESKGDNSNLNFENSYKTKWV